MEENNSNNVGSGEDNLLQLNQSLDTIAEIKSDSGLSTRPNLDDLRKIPEPSQPPSEHSQKSAPPQPPAQPHPNLAPAQPPAKKLSKTSLKIIAVLSGFLILIIILSIFYAQPKIVLQNLPVNAKIVFDGKQIKDQTISTSPGTHYLKISLAGYVTLDKTFETRYFSRVKQNAQLRSLPLARQIVTKDAFSLSQDSQNTVYYLDNESKTIYKLTSANGKTSQTAITPSLSQQIDKVIFSPDFSLAIFKLAGGETGLYDFNRYDLLHQNYTAWGDNIGDVIWRQDGKKILYYENLDGKKILNLADKNKENVERLIFLDEYQIAEPQALGWTSDQDAALIVAGNALYLFDINSKTAPSLVAQTAVHSAKFSPDGKKILFTQNNALKMVEFKLEPATDNGESGKFSITPPVDLGLQAISDQAIITPDSQKIIAYTKNGLKEYDLVQSKTREFSYENRDSLVITDLQVSSDEQTLYFLTQDKKLMSLPLDKGEY